MMRSRQAGDFDCKKVDRCSTKRNESGINQFYDSSDVAFSAGSKRPRTAGGSLLDRVQLQCVVTGNMRGVGTKIPGRASRSDDKESTNDTSTHAMRDHFDDGSCGLDSFDATSDSGGLRVLAAWTGGKTYVDKDAMSGAPTAPSKQHKPIITNSTSTDVSFSASTSTQVEALTGGDPTSAQNSQRPSIDAAASFARLQSHLQAVASRPMVPSSGCGAAGIDALGSSSSSCVVVHPNICIEVDLNSAMPWLCSGEVASSVFSSCAASSPPCFSEAKPKIAGSVDTAQNMTDGFLNGTNMLTAGSDLAPVLPPVPVLKTLYAPMDAAVHVERESYTTDTFSPMAQYVNSLASEKVPAAIRNLDATSSITAASIVRSLDFGANTAEVSYRNPQRINGQNTLSTILPYSQTRLDRSTGASGGISMLAALRQGATPAKVGANAGRLGVAQVRHVKSQDWPHQQPLAHPALAVGQYGGDGIGGRPYLPSSQAHLQTPQRPLTVASHTPWGSQPRGASVPAGGNVVAMSASRGLSRLRSTAVDIGAVQALSAAAAASIPSAMGPPLQAWPGAGATPATAAYAFDRHAGDVTGPAGFHISASGYSHTPLPNPELSFAYAPPPNHQPPLTRVQQHAPGWDSQAFPYDHDSRSGFGNSAQEMNSFMWQQQQQQQQRLPQPLRPVHGYSVSASGVEAAGSVMRSSQQRVGVLVQTMMHAPQAQLTPPGHEVLATSVAERDVLFGHQQQPPQFHHSMAAPYARATLVSSDLPMTPAPRDTSRW